MKISILGYSGSGKSTLAQKLGNKYEIDVLHLDTVQFLPGWEIRAEEEKQRITKEFLDTHTSWVIDGNYSGLYFEQRMQEADKIILLLFNRFSCLNRAFKRYRKYKNSTRPDMAEGCEEKFDIEFIKWILFGGRGKRAKRRYQGVISDYRDKVIVIKTQSKLDSFMGNIM